MHLHDGEKIAFIRSLKGMKQSALGLRQQVISDIENTGRVHPKHWPKIEQSLGMKREEIQALDEAALARFKGGDQPDGNNVVVSYVMNLTFNGVDAAGLEQLKALLDHAAALQDKYGGRKE